MGHVLPLQSASVIIPAQFNLKSLSIITALVFPFVQRQRFTYVIYIQSFTSHHLQTLLSN